MHTHLKITFKFRTLAVSCFCSSTKLFQVKINTTPAPCTLATHVLLLSYLLNESYRLYVPVPDVRISAIVRYIKVTR